MYRKPVPLGEKLIVFLFVWALASLMVLSIIAGLMVVGAAFVEYQLLRVGPVLSGSTLISLPFAAIATVQIFTTKRL